MTEMAGLKNHIGITALALALCLTACKKMPGGESPGEEGQVLLRFSPQANEEVMTRAGAVTDEIRITSIDLLAFDADGNTTLHLQPDVRWDGTAYLATVRIQTIVGKHSLYLVANHPMQIGSVDNVDALMRVNDARRSADGSVNAPFTMSTDEIMLQTLSSGAIQEALKNSDNVFRLKRNVSKFTVENTAAGFTLTEVNWINMPNSAAVVENPNYFPTIDPNRYRRGLSEPIYVYKQPLFWSDANRAFHLLVRGNYAGQEYVYKLRLFNPDGTPFTSIERNTHYTVTITGVSGVGMADEEQAMKNGFANDLQAIVQKEVESQNARYRFVTLHGGYQMGFDCMNWTIYRDAVTVPVQLGYAYRLIRDASLVGFTTFDPYSGMKVDDTDIAAPADVLQIEELATGRKIDGEITCSDAVDRAYEMKLSFTDVPQKGEEYRFTGLLRYGVLFQQITVDRHPALDAGYHVLPQQKTFYGEVVDYENHDWINLSEQRHENTTLKSAVLDTENDNIFIHVEKNTTGITREGTVRCIGPKGYYEVHIMQK